MRKIHLILISLLFLLGINLVFGIYHGDGGAGGGAGSGNLGTPAVPGTAGYTPKNNTTEVSYDKDGKLLAVYLRNGPDDDLFNRLKVNPEDWQIFYNDPERGLVLLEGNKLYFFINQQWMRTDPELFSFANRFLTGIPWTVAVSSYVGLGGVTGNYLITNKLLDTCDGGDKKNGPGNLLRVVEEGRHNPRAPNPDLFAKYYGKDKEYTACYDWRIAQNKQGDDIEEPTKEEEIKKVTPEKKVEEAKSEKSSENVFFKKIPRLASISRKLVDLLDRRKQPPVRRIFQSSSVDSELGRNKVIKLKKLKPGDSVVTIAGINNSARTRRSAALENLKVVRKYGKDNGKIQEEGTIVFATTRFDKKEIAIVMPADTNLDSLKNVKYSSDIQFALETENRLPLSSNQLAERRFASDSTEKQNLLGKRLSSVSFSSLLSSLPEVNEVLHLSKVDGVLKITNTQYGNCKLRDDFQFQC